MASNHLDQLFLRFAQTGEPEALAAVFDEVAPRLLLLASHLCADRAVADDLLQETFLAAIRSAEDYSEDKPLLPWLSGILANRARVHLRNKSRQIDPGRLAKPDSVAPLEHAQAEELTEQLAHTIDSMPQQFREVLLLRLHHGMTSLEIAHTLALSPDTVRTQIRRGLELVRAKLPKGFVVPALIVLEPGRALCDIKHEVLSQVTPVTATSGPTAVLVSSILGLLQMTKFSTVAIVLVAVSVLGTALAWQPWVVSPTSEPNLAAPSVDSTPLDEQELPVSPQRQRVEVAQRGLESDLGALQQSILICQCVHAGTGVGIPNCRVWIWDKERAGHDKRHETRTDTEGRMRFVWPRAPEGDWNVLVEASGYVQHNRRVPVAGPDASIDIGIVQLVPGCQVSGMVRDASGHPLPGAEITLLVGTQLETVEYITADYLGGFVCKQILPPGDLTVSSRHSRYRCVSASVNRIEVGMRSHVVNVVLAEVTDTLTGIVVDRLGEPMADVRVFARYRERGRGSQRAGATTTGVDGRFTLYSEAGRAGPMSLRLRELNAMLKHKTNHPGAVYWGERNIRVEVDRLHPVTLVVVDAESGAPVPYVKIQLFRAGTRTANKSDGRSRLALPTGNHELYVSSGRNKGIGMSPVHIEMPRDHGREIRVVLPETVERPVRVEDLDGNVIAGSQVRVVRVTEGRVLTVESKLTVPGSSRSLSIAESDGVELSKARTNAVGETDIVIPRLSEQIRLLVSGDHRPRLIAYPGSDPSQPLVIAVDLGNVVRGRVEPVQSLARFGGKVGLLFDPFDHKNPRRRVGWDENGEFEVSDLAPGRYRVLLKSPNQAYVRQGEVFRSHILLAELRVTEGQKGIVLDLSDALVAWTPAKLTAFVLRDGHPLMSTRVYVLQRRKNGRWEGARTVGPFETDEQGVLRAHDLKAGTYRMKAGDLLSDEVVTLVAGETREVRLHLQLHALRLRLLDNRGRPSQGALVYARCPDDPRVLRGRTDEAGYAEIAKLTSGTWQIMMETGDYEAMSARARTKVESKKAGVLTLGHVRIGEEPGVVTREFKMPVLGK